MCDAEKTSAVMVFCGEKRLGGDDEVELLREPWGKGLLERLDGLVLVGLGPRAILSWVGAVLQRALRDEEVSRGCKKDRWVGWGVEADAKTQVCD